MNFQHPADEVVSAVLDGEASSDEVAHVHGCTECSARLEAFRAIAAGVGAIVEPPSAAVRDAAVAAALNAPPARVVLPLWRRPAPVLLGAAAAIVAVVLAVGTLSNGGPDTTNALRGPASLKAAEGAGASAGASVGGTAEMDRFTAAIDLGALDPSTLVAAVREQLARPSAAYDSAATSAAPAAPEVACEPSARHTHPELGDDTPVQEFRATWDGQPAHVYVFGAAPGEIYVDVTTVDCRSLYSERFHLGS
jgi:hypothetical protein